MFIYLQFDSLYPGSIREASCLPSQHEASVSLSLQAVEIENSHPPQSFSFFLFFSFWRSALPGKRNEISGSLWPPLNLKPPSPTLSWNVKNGNITERILSWLSKLPGSVRPYFKIRGVCSHLSGSLQGVKSSIVSSFFFFCIQGCRTELKITGSNACGSKNTACTLLDDSPRRGQERECCPLPSLVKITNLMIKQTSSRYEASFLLSL